MSTQTLEQTTRSVRTADHQGSPLALRVAGIAALAGIIAVHWMDLGGKMAEVKYLGVGYLLLMAGCALSAVLLLRDDRATNQWGWRIGGTVAAATFVGFVLTRTVGLPQAMDDKGNWSEAIGTWSLVFEGVFVALSMTALRLLRRPALAV